MDKALLQPFLGADEIAEDEVTKVDTDAEKLIAKAQADDAGAVTGERLLIDLAYDFAEGQHTDLFTAYKGLRAALEAAQELKAQGSLPQNTSSQLDVVLRRVAEMNEEGDRDGAAEFLDAEKERLSAEAEALFNAQLKQDRVRNRPDLAARRIYKDAGRMAHETGRKRFEVIRGMVDELRRDGDHSGDIFTLQTALDIAKANYNAANGKQVASALHDLGWCQFRLAERSTNERHLTVARNAFEAALKKTNKSRQPIAWAARQNGLALAICDIGIRSRDPALMANAVEKSRAALTTAETHGSPNVPNYLNSLGNCIRSLGETTENPVLLEEAVACLTKALALREEMVRPNRFVEAVENNLGLAQRWLGAITGNLDILRQARASYRLCEAIVSHEVEPMTWAVVQWNIADLALARYKLDPDPAHIAEAREYITRARDFFVEGSEYQTQRCDDLIAQIDAAEAAA